MAGPRSKTGPGALRTQDNEARAVAMRRRGSTYEAIGRALDITRQSAHELVKRAMQRAAGELREEASEALALELARLDAMQRVAWRIARTGDLQAIDRVLRISERRAKLLGLDAATRLALTGTDGGRIDVQFVWPDEDRGEAAAAAPTADDGGEEPGEV